MGTSLSQNVPYLVYIGSTQRLSLSPSLHSSPWTKYRISKNSGDFWVFVRPSIQATDRPSFFWYRLVLISCYKASQPETRRWLTDNTWSSSGGHYPQCMYSKNGSIAGGGGGECLMNIFIRGLRKSISLLCLLIVVLSHLHVTPSINHAHGWWGTVAAAAYSIPQLRSSQVLREISYHRCDCYYLTFFTFTKSPFVLLAHSLSPIIIIMWPTTKVIEQRQIIIIITKHFPGTLLWSNRLVLHLCGSPMADR